ncbi:excinuclease ABC subunit UvrC [Magnetovibrio sp. PR-2]|uniref:excinuclease ABC subunit UvrC n=1 Tax=Magnetovibrio sp. PR-2 TaxID=3120356 RepID=UPI002FCDFCF3
MQNGDETPLEQDQDLGGQDDAQPLQGVDVIEQHLKTLPAKPGVYRMLGEAGKVLYVGKAKNLKKRVASYTKPERQSIRIRRMVAQTRSMEFVTTHTEAEALLLESNLIKKLAPRYNILLRDDKSFPEILVTSSHDFPRVLKHRGAHKVKGEYFGPFASVWAVNETLTVLQRAFLLRTCTDNVFANRTRPCLLFQIKRCSGPCVEGKIDQKHYAELVDESRQFLQGKSQDIQKRLANQMQTASDDMEFEKAAEYRDRIRALTRIQQHQDINPGNAQDADVVALHQKNGLNCVQVFFFRGGRNFGNRAYFPTQAKGEGEPEVLEAFLGQFYAQHRPPREILLSHKIPNTELVADALAVRAERKVKLSRPTRGDRANLVSHAHDNARDALARRSAEYATQEKMLEDMAGLFDLDHPPQRIEVYDNSHISGTNAVGAMIVAGPEGFRKNAYRKFNIRGASNTEAGEDGFAPGDDYAMMKEVLTRRFKKALKDVEEAGGERGADWPDLLLIDGGKGQLSVVLEVMETLGVEGVTVAGVSKGPDRNAGREQIHLPGQPVKHLHERDLVLYFIQRLRDEAHRFAIGTHRAKRSKAQAHSKLDDIPSIGAKRKKALLHHFGSAKAVEESGLVDLEAVDGISKSIAKQIYDWFHPDA